LTAKTPLSAFTAYGKNPRKIVPLDTLETIQDFLLKTRKNTERIMIGG